MFLFFIGMLVVFRLSLLIAKEDGPYDVIFKWKKRQPPNGFWFGLTKCFHCLSIWFGLLVSPFIVERHYGLIPLYALALSGAAIIIYSILEAF